MKKLLFLSLFGLLTSAIFAQKNMLSNANDSDPEATALLKKVKQKYETYSSVGMDFSLIIKIPEMSEEVQKGSLQQQGDKYRLEMKDQLIFSDSKTMWLYLRNLNEVQVMDAAAMEEGMLSPKDLLKIYERKDFVYALTNRLKKNGRLIQQIEFKPLDINMDYSKLRVSVDHNTHEILQIEAFGKDNARYTLVVEKLTPNVSVSDATFRFNEKEYPDVYVEDLRN